MSHVIWLCDLHGAKSDASHGPDVWDAGKDLASFREALSEEAGLVADVTWTMLVLDGLLSFAAVKDLPRFRKRVDAAKNCFLEEFDAE